MMRVLAHAVHSRFVFFRVGNVFGVIPHAHLALPRHRRSEGDEKDATETQEHHQSFAKHVITVTLSRYHGRQARPRDQEESTEERRVRRSVTREFKYNVKHRKPSEYQREHQSDAITNARARR